MQELKERLLGDYDSARDTAGFSGERLAGRLAAIAAIGPTPQGGSSRPGFSREEKQAKDLACTWMKALGLAVRSDAAGNCFGRLAGRNDALPAILCGSHLDTVPNGGHFDGVLGVLLAIEAVEMWRSTGFVPERPFEIAIFSDEEGSRFNLGLAGSSVMTGALETGDLEKLVDHDGLSFPVAVEQVGLAVSRFSEARRDLSDVAAYIEVHIEQGLVLERRSLPIGIVSGICGLVGIQMTVKGVAGHAGATPMGLRRDALVAASRIVAAISALPAGISPTAVATVGQLNVFPNGSNVIPGEVRFSVDIRDAEAASLDRLVALIVETAGRIAEQAEADLAWSHSFRVAPTPAAPQPRALQAETLSELGVAPFQLPSGAGHDAMVLGQHVPMAMFFLRSREGTSHNPREFTSLGDCAIGAQALARLLAKLVSTPPP